LDIAKAAGTPAFIIRGDVTSEGLAAMVDEL